MHCSVPLRATFIATAILLAACDNKTEVVANTVANIATSAAIESKGVTISEADLGIPFYPGAKLSESDSSKVVSPQGLALSARLQSNDTAEKVAGFYREKLKAMSEHSVFSETKNAEGQAALVVADTKANNSILINISKSTTGSDINIVVTRSNKAN